LRVEHLDSMKKLKIAVCDFANEFEEIDNKSIPIGVGYVATYTKQKFGDQVDVQVFRTFKPFWASVLESPPDVAGFGSYDWNHNLTLRAIDKLKVLNPNCVTVFGGANAEIQPDKNLIMLKKHPNVDFIVYGDGEKPFANIVERFILAQKAGNSPESIKKEPLNGARTLVNNELVTGESIDPVMAEEIDNVPSPYLTGLFDSLLENPSLMPILQNMRGCPYSCRYCVSGTQYGKIRHFSFERVTAEIEYLRLKAKNRFIRFSDDNFGIIDHDLQVAQYVRESFDRTQYPAGLKAYSAKRQNDRTREVAKTLKPLMTYCISLQTTTPKVLKETKRVSATHAEAVECLAYARQHSLATATELIFGLPGETLQSWKEVIDTTMTYSFDSVSMNPLWLLKGSELNRSEVREENQYKGKFMLAENAITIDGDFFSIERDEIAISSKYYSYEDWKMFLRYQILLLMLNFYGYGRELIYYARSLGVTLTMLFDHLLASPEKYQTVQQLTTEYVKNYTSHMFDSEEVLQDFVKKFIEEHPGDREAIVSLGKARGFFGYVVKYMFDDPEYKFLHEIRNAVLSAYQGNHVAEREEEADSILDLALHAIINPRRPFVPDIRYKSHYDLLGWVKEGYSKPLSEYRLEKPGDFLLLCRNKVTVGATIQKDREQGRKDCFYFFRYMNSGLMRRYVAEPIETVGDQPIPHEPFLREHRTTGPAPA